MSSLRRKKRGQIKQSLEEIQAEEAKQGQPVFPGLSLFDATTSNETLTILEVSFGAEANRIRLLSFMNQIQAAVEGISAIDPLRG
jgi:hypothetical protein